MHEIRRDDGELCGYVLERDGHWVATTVFGGLLGSHHDRERAVEQVRRDGLPSLAERWTLIDHDSGIEQVVCIQEASPHGVTLALDYYSVPGVPTLALTTDELTDGRWLLRRA